ncbi:Aldehyde/histidinol dehydrogenase [Schizophyllum amplum]|uniref:Aldehyde/histidinol dehydrogenase n=1 Tax=Schizophyllum amplum TaxID=97359 RepID=A0A550CCZ4_9AGAR|nr:Aldehyde/histidinol dehydrogenase [Auriculariopsis ampla]
MLDTLFPVAFLASLAEAKSSTKKYVAEERSDFDTILWPIVLCFAGGIYLVYERYQRAHNSPVPFVHHPPVQADPSWEGLPLENANLQSHLQHPDYITSFDPATSLHLGTFLADDESVIRNKIDKAAKAQKRWRHTTFVQRRRVVRSLLKWLVDNQEMCAKVACRDTGKTLLDAALGEIMTTCTKMEWLMKHGERYLKPERRHGNFMLGYKRSEVHYEPLGVVAAIVSWNYPLHNAWGPVLASIFAGNAVVLKCSEKVIWSTTWFVDAITTCLRTLGHSEDIIQLVCCYPKNAHVLTRSPVIKHITFIGSETVGRIIAQDATEHLTPVTLELGGKDPCIIMPNTDLGRWAPLWKRGVFQNMGQNCIGIERLIVHSSQYDELEAIFKETASKMRLGSVLAPTQEGYVATIDGGAMIDGDRFQALEALIQDAEEGGANVIGGRQYNHVYLENGYYFQPTVVGPVDNSMEIAQQELFAPIALLMPYETIEEALELANGTRYGLGASVFGPSQAKCLELAKRLECGMVSINDFGVFYVSIANQDLPFGGYKSSGYGRFGGPEGLRALTNPKAIMVDRWPNVIQTAIPPVLDYPLRSLLQSWEFSSGLVRFLYADGARNWMYGLYALIQAASKGRR